jgi:hypothetical protein
MMSSLISSPSPVFGGAIADEARPHLSPLAGRGSRGARAIGDNPDVFGDEFRYGASSFPEVE